MTSQRDDMTVPPPTADPGPAGWPAATTVPDDPAVGDDRTEPEGQVRADGQVPAGQPAAALAEQQWPAIQAMFVDDPRGAVERAAAAAHQAARSLVRTLEREQNELLGSWQRDADTEGLRTALQRYRAFCGRIEGLG